MYEEREYIDKDDTPVKLQNKENVSVNAIHSMTSYACMRCEEQDRKRFIGNV